MFHKPLWCLCCRRHFHSCFGFQYVFAASPPSPPPLLFWLKQNEENSAWPSRHGHLPVTITHAQENQLTGGRGSPLLMVVELLVHVIVWILVFGPVGNTKWWKHGGETPAQLMVGANRLHRPSQRWVCSLQSLPRGLAIQSRLHYLPKAPSWGLRLYHRDLGRHFRAKHPHTHTAQWVKCPSVPWRWLLNSLILHDTIKLFS